MAAAVSMHQDLLNLTVKYEKELRSYYYVTPTSYLELMDTFKRLLNQRQNFMKNMIQRYEAGVDKIKDTEIKVGEMQRQLEDLQPKLEKST